MIDERLDLALIGSLARAHPDWSVMMVGPVVKISPEDLPRAPNLHWLGQRSYDQLPAYLSGWDVALMPFALNESTRFISPTKTPEYLAGGVQVVSTAIRDVVRRYGELAAVQIADGPDDFVRRCETALAPAPPAGALARRSRPTARRRQLGPHLRAHGRSSRPGDQSAPGLAGRGTGVGGGGCTSDCGHGCGARAAARDCACDCDCDRSTATAASMALSRHTRLPCCAAPASTT